MGGELDGLVSSWGRLGKNVRWGGWAGVSLLAVEAENKTPRSDKAKYGEVYRGVRRRVMRLEGDLWGGGGQSRDYGGWVGPGARYCDSGLVGRLVSWSVGRLVGGRLTVNLVTMVLLTLPLVAFTAFLFVLLGYHT